MLLGLLFSEFKGYEDWPAAGPSQSDAQNVIGPILANAAMIGTRPLYANGKAVPRGLQDRDE
jgi:hypothetical protein